MYEINQQINIHVLDVSAPPASPNTGIIGVVGDFIVGNVIGIILVVVIMILTVVILGLFCRRYGSIGKIKFGVTVVAMLLLSVLASQFTNFVKADPMLTLDAETIDVTIQKPALSTTATSIIHVPSDIELYDYNVKLNSITDNRISIELNGITLTNSETLVASNSNVVSYILYYTISITNDLPVGNYIAELEHEVIEKIEPVCSNLNPGQECFAFSVDTRMTDTLFVEGDTPDTNPAHFAGTVTSFAIPTSGYVNTTFNHAYDWIVNCGSGQADQVVSGASSVSSAGIICNYPTPGQYQITIKSNGVATPGWMDAFGFGGMGGASAYSNAILFKSIDTPFTNKMRSPGSTYRFGYVFYLAINADAIPADLFSSIDASHDVDLTGMFMWTFNLYAVNNTTATIPAGLFDSIDTSHATNLSNTFDSTFSAYARNSITATIPAGLFDSINTSNATNLSYMFNQTFETYASNSTTATIPAGLFDSIDTSNTTNLRRTFMYTFWGYASSSTIGTIPSGLFDSIDTSSATNLNDMFYATFREYAFANKLSGTPDTDINDIWGNANFSTVTAANAKSVFDHTFYDMPSLTGTAQTFINTKLGGINPNSWAGTFRNTGVTDLASLDTNWK